MEDNAEKNLKELEKEITCFICQEHYTLPKLLPCLHYYCKHCILRLALKTGKYQPFFCPKCRKEAILPEGNEDNLQTAFFLKRFNELYEKQKRALSKEEVICEICTAQFKAEAFCRQCNKFICKKCGESHERMKAVFDGHEVISLDEAKKERAKVLLTKDPRAKCQIHRESLKMFCFSCNQLICHDCTINEHKDHDFEFNNKVATNRREELIESLKPLREVSASLSIAVEEIQTTECELVAKGESVAKQIEVSFEEFHTIIERHKQNMLDEAKRNVREKMEKLESQKKNISISIAEIQNIIEHTEKCVKHCLDDDAILMHAEVGSTIQSKIEEYDKPVKSLKPLEVDISVEVGCAEALVKLLQNQTKIFELPVCLAINTVSSKAEMGTLSEVILYTTKQCNIKPAKRASQIDCHMKCLHSGTVIKTNVGKIGTNQYRIQFTPTLRGRHELTVAVGGHQIAGSPFPVLVPIPPTQLSEPVKVWDDLTWPIGITVNSIGEIIVAEYFGDVVVLDEEGKRLRSINCSEYQFQHLQGIAVDSVDNIYFTDAGTDRIFKSNKNCSKVHVHRVQQAKGPGHHDVAVVGDEVMVTECGNEGRIMVYDRELNYVRQIVATHKNTLLCLSPDRHHNVYVSDRGNSIIQVFSNDGEFLHSFDCDENGVKMFGSPWGVCVAGQYVYVGDNGVRKVVVFTTEGDYVTSFGRGYYDVVCVDQDGFVYANGSNSIDIY